MIEILLLFATVTLCAYSYFNNPFKYWLKRSVVSPSTKDIIKFNYQQFFQRIPVSDFVEAVYKSTPGSRYIGYYDIFTPNLLIKDPELIKQITVKDFDHFLNHQTIIPAECDPYWGKNLFALKDEKWKEMRSILSPAFTSSKMRLMFSLFCKNAQQFSDFFKQQDENLLTVDLKDSFERFANDIIASSAFGIELDSLKDRNNDFYRLGKKITDPGLLVIMKFILYTFIPSVSKIMKLNFYAQDVIDFFCGIISENIKTREKKSIVRPDMINLLMDARKNGLKYDESAKEEENEAFATVQESEIGRSDKIQKPPLTDEDITAQAMLFFLAGYASVSSTMCLMAYELAVNPEVQEKLLREIDEVFEENSGELSYETLQDMKYLDMVVSEALRKWPSTVDIDRVCSKPYTIDAKSPDEVPVTIEKDQVVWISIYGMHRDPQHFPNPDKFDPERFNEENKTKIKPYTFLPFGSGPRNCIGSRFAILEMKTMFCYLLKEFEIVAVDKTDVPIKLDRRTFNIEPEGGLWLGLKRRIN